MEKIELDKRKRFYFLGIGGISMSALAILLKEKGNLIGGCDICQSDTCTLLQEWGIEVDFGFSEKKIAEADFVVYSSAIKEDNIHLVAAKRLGKVILTRGQLLGVVAKEFDKVIAVAGSHGKTTTTAMIFEVLKAAGKNPTLHLGGFRCEDGKNFCLGGKEFFVTEACEYCDNFLNLFPFASVITNVEKEHLDYFKTFERQLQSFEKFRGQSQHVVEGEAGLFAKNLRHKKDGRLSFDLCENGRKIFRLNLNLCEEVNTQNCIFAYRICKILDLEDEQIKTGLENFKGVKTRFERVDCKWFDNVLCDYSHHPTEIEKAIFSARKIFKGKRLVVVFQPHTFSRTRDFLEDFVRVLKEVDVPILFRTYSAREKESDGVSAKALAQVLKKENKSTRYAEDFEGLKRLLEKLDREDVVMFVGAGDLPVILHKNKFLS